MDERLPSGQPPATDLTGWRAINLANWESRVPVHAAPGGYDLDAFDDPGHLTDAVRFDLPRLGRLDGLDVVHLQCHIGTDTASLARLGARSVTGLDFSPAALAVARTLATRAGRGRPGSGAAGTPIEFVHADVYDAPTALGTDRFDLVYTGSGALCWLPSVTRWADVVAALLRPGGRLFIREGHPMLWAMADPRPDGLLVVEHPYFEDAGTRFSEVTTYAGDGELTSPAIIQFNHGLAEIMRAIFGAGLMVTAFDEHREVPWNQLGAAMVASDEHPGEFVLAFRPDRLPGTYTLQATKPAG